MSELPIYLCECYWDCGTCSLSGEPHQHASDPCPVHPGAAEDVSGGLPLSTRLQREVDAEHDWYVDRAHSLDRAAR